MRHSMLLFFGALLWLVAIVRAESVAFLSLDPTASGQIYASWYAQGTDAETLWYNPATLRHKGISVHASHTHYLSDISYNTLSASYNNYAVGVIYNTDGIMSETWLRGAYTLSFHGIGIATTYTHYVVSIKNPERSMADAEASGSGNAFSLHASYRIKNISAGFTVHNVWGEVAWESTYFFNPSEFSLSHKEQLERALSATVEYSFLSHGIPIKAALGSHNDFLCGSIAYSFSNLSLVVGYRDQFPAYSLGVVARSSLFNVMCGYVLTPYANYYTAGFSFYP